MNVTTEPTKTSEQPDRDEELCYGMNPSPIPDFLDNVPTGTMRILDVGGAYGRDAISLALKFSEIEFVVADKDEVELEKGRRIAKCKSLTNVDFKRADVTNDDCDLSDSEKKYGVIFSYSLLHLFDEKTLAAVLRRLQCALTPNGRMVHMFLSDLDETFSRESRRIQRHEKSKLIEACKNAGLTFDIEYAAVCEWHGAVHHHIMWLLRCGKMTTQG